MGTAVQASGEDEDSELMSAAVVALKLILSQNLMHTEGSPVDKILTAISMSSDVHAV